MSQVLADLHFHGLRAKPREAIVTSSPPTIRSLTLSQGSPHTWYLSLSNDPTCFLGVSGSDLRSLVRDGPRLKPSVGSLQPLPWGLTAPERCLVMHKATTNHKIACGETREAWSSTEIREPGQRNRGEMVGLGSSRFCQAKILHWEYYNST